MSVFFSLLAHEFFLHFCSSLPHCLQRTGNNSRSRFALSTRQCIFHVKSRRSLNLTYGIGLWRESGSDGHLWDPCDTTLTGDDHSLGSDDWNSGSNEWAWTDDDTTACRSQIFEFPINGNVFGYGEECEEIWVPTYAAGQLADATDDGSCSLTSSSNWNDDGEKGFTTYDVSDASVEEGLQRIVDNSRRRDGQSFKMQGSVFFRMTSMDDVWVSWSL